MRARIISIVIPHGYASAEEFLKDTEFEPAPTEPPTAWAATGNPLRDPLLTGSEFIADMWRKSGLTVHPLYTRKS